MRRAQTLLIALTILSIEGACPQPEHEKDASGKDAQFFDSGIDADGADANGPDSTSTDTVIADVNDVDTGSTDSSIADTGSVDTGSTDSSIADTRLVDMGSTDSCIADMGVDDAHRSDLVVSNDVIVGDDVHLADIEATADTTISCFDQCTDLNSTSCENGMLRHCELGQDACLIWGEAVPCDEGSCSDTQSCTFIPPETMRSPFVSTGAWTWRYPLPSAADNLAIKILPDGEVWIAAEAGQLIRFADEAWSQVETGTMNDLRDIWGADDNDVWVVGNAGTVLHIRDHAVTALPFPTSSNVRAVWGDGIGSVRFGAEDGTIAIYRDGEIETEYQAAQAIHAIGGGQDATLWAVGSGGLVLVKRGDTWAVDSTFVNSISELQTVVVSSSGDVWITGSKVYRRIGNTWYDLGRPMSETLRHVATSPSGDVFFSTASGKVFRYADGAFSLVCDVGYYNATVIAAASSNDVWIAGQTGTIFHQVSGSLRPVSMHFADVFNESSVVLDDVAVLNSGEVLVSGMALDHNYDHFGLLARYGDDQWQKLLPWNGRIGALWGSSSDSIWAIDGAGYQLAYFDGAVWQTQEQCEDGNYGAIHGTSANNVWIAMDRGQLCHYDGQSLSKVSSAAVGANLYDVFLLSPTDGFAVGANGTILRLIAGHWSLMSSPTDSDIYSVWAASPDEAWAVAGAAEILHWDGELWSSVTAPAGDFSLSALWGHSGSVWFGGNVLMSHDDRGFSVYPVADNVVSISGATGYDDVAITISGGILTRSTVR